MTRFLPKLYLDISSFWAGIVLVIILIALYLRFRKQLKGLITRSLRKLIDFRESLTVSSDEDYLQVLNKYTQGLHIGADYFPLNSILIPPHCTAPPPSFYPGKITLETSLIQQTIGYDPLQPELGAEYFNPSFTLTEAVFEEVNLCLLGHPGTGKTTALASCISDLIKNLARENSPYQRIPFYIKAHHLLDQFPDSNIMGVLLKAIQSNKAFQIIPNFPNYLTETINSGRGVLFLDDLDLLSLKDIDRITNFLKALCNAVPELQLVTVAAPTCLGNLRTLGLEFISIGTWGDSDKYALLAKLEACWPNPINVSYSDSERTGEVRHAMMVVSDHFSTPLEFTLKSYAAYAGDLIGPDSAHSIESFLNRQIGQGDNIAAALEILALYALVSQQSYFTKRDLNPWLHDFYQRWATEESQIKFPAFGVIVNAGLESGILDTVSADTYYFRCSTIAGYLASRALVSLKPEGIVSILESPDWCLMHECMRYFSRFNDIKPYLNRMLDDHSLLRNRMRRASLWLGETATNSPEEMVLLKRLTREIGSNPFHMTKIRFICALIRCSNPTVKGIFQHLLNVDDFDTRRAAAIGCGLLRDLKAVPQLIERLNDPFPVNTAACYALGLIGSPRSLEAVAEALLHGTELLRRAAAESLAQNRSEGHPALREGAGREDLLVRYAVVHGLSLIHEDWSLDILETMRIDEKEWVVRDLAQQSFDRLKGGSPYLPHTCPPADTAPWLSHFAKSQGIPEPTSENALEYLQKALEEGTTDEKQFALAHLARSGNQDVVPRILPIIEESQSDLELLAELAAWFLVPPRYQVVH
jgi:HEAT repeat protein